MEPDYYNQMAEIQNQHWWYEGRRRILQALIADLPLPSRAKILEAGCGTGANLAMLDKFGEVQAFEPYAPARTHAANIVASIPIEDGALPAPVPFDGPFDLIGAFDVLEHIEDDKASVRALYDRTRENGYGIFTVPAFPFMWSEHDEINHHKRRYRKADFGALLADAGYQIKLLSYYNMFLFTPAAAVRFGKKILKKTDQPDLAMPRHPAVNKALCSLFSAEKTLLKKTSLPFGLSLIAIGRKERRI